MSLIKGLMTLYYPDINIDRLKKLASQLHTLFLLDNTPDSVHYVTGIENTNIVYIKYRHNYGLSKAFNLCLKNNAFNDDDYIIFFDQDSNLPDDFIKNKIKEFEAVSAIHKVGVLGNIFFEITTGTQKIHKIKRQILPEIYSVSTVITSGMLTTYCNLKSIGLWNEDIFLDYADYDLCWRFIKNGYLCCVSANNLFYHTIGEKSKLRFFVFSSYPPVRAYYQIRDIIKLIFTNYMPLSLKIRAFLNIVIKLLNIVILMNNKKKRIRYALQGLIDGLNKINGEYLAKKYETRSV